MAHNWPATSLGPWWSISKGLAGNAEEFSTRRMRFWHKEILRHCGEHVGADGNVTYDAPYVVVTARRR
jgi:hypothetical protein